MAVVCRPSADDGAGGCVVVYDGMDVASARPCLFLTTITARSLVELLSQALPRMTRPEPCTQGDPLVETKVRAG